MAKPVQKKVAETARAKTEVPADVIKDLMQHIRNQFVQHWTPQQWYQFYGFIKREVVTWPAGYLTGKGVSIPALRYKEILLTVFKGIKRHGDTGQVKYWPGYLQFCVQEHFKKHGDEYYEEGKSIRSLAELAMMGVREAQAATQDTKVVEAIGQVHDAMVTAHRKKKAKPQTDQLSLF